MITTFKIFENTFEINSIEDIKDYAIMCDNDKEKIMIVAKILRTLGFDVFDPTMNLGSWGGLNYMNLGWRGLHYVKYKNREYFVQSNCTGDKQISYEDFITIVKNKFHLNIDNIIETEFNNMDPYGEEQWEDDEYKWIYIDDLNENTNEFDPYGEEKWEEEPYKIRFKVGDKIDNGGNVYGIIRSVNNDPEKRYSVQFFAKKDDRLAFWAWQKDSDIKRLYENINEFDPYGEEWWDDDIEIKTGSIVRCITTCTTMGICVNEGEQYEVIKVSEDNDGDDQGGYFIQIKGKANLIKKDFFKSYSKNELLDQYEQDDEIIKYDGIIPIWWPKRAFIQERK